MDCRSPTSVRAGGRNGLGFSRFHDDVLNVRGPLPCTMDVSGEAFPPGTFLQSLKFLEEGHLPAIRTLHSAINGLERSSTWTCEHLQPKLFGGGHCNFGVVYLQGYPKRRTLGRWCVFDGVDVANVRGCGELNCRRGDVQYCHSILTIGCESWLFRETKDVAVKTQGAIEVVCFDDQTQLLGRL